MLEVLGSVSEARADEAPAMLSLAADENLPSTSNFNTAVPGITLGAAMEEVIRNADER